MSTAPGPELAGLQIADPPAHWEALGFAVAGAQLSLGGVTIELVDGGDGITGWALRNLPAPQIEGLPITTIMRPALEAARAEHPNGAIAIDHVVVLTPEFDRTAAALAEAGMPLRRIRHAGSFRQGFRRLGPAILELVEAPGTASDTDRVARFWGLVIVVSDLEALQDRLGDRLGEIKAAVQPRRHIATLRDAAGLSAKVAFMDPEPLQPG